MIFVEKDEPLSRGVIEHKLHLLREVLETEDDDQIRHTLKQVVPTYRAPELVNAEAIERVGYREKRENDAAVAAG